MKYMVMECYFSYAVVLGENGKFLKVANLHYEVGQTVTNIVEMQQTDQQGTKKYKNRWIYTLAAMAACLMLIITPALQVDQMIYGSVSLMINPMVRIDVNQEDVVVGLEGNNEDGKILIADYRYKRKHLDVVMDELVDKAIDMGYLYDGGKITLTLDAEDNAWIVNHSNTLSRQLNEHLSEKMSVTVTVVDSEEENYKVTIPVLPSEDSYDASVAPLPSASVSPSSTFYHETDYGDTDGGGTDYIETEGSGTDYVETKDGESDYAETDYEATDYGTETEDD